eukprot:TRINITY_DN33507_c0_g1_i1.p1 TRINITY_DN33507_c0_g1~~TRINITY_DN33507_c0_g1_i1.p1  ORF type:complete len:419 (+),score=76.17 TRINITY_DN33507_c0_g1_i1:165-1259(+)
MRHCDKVEAAMRSRAISAADTTSLSAAFPIVGLAEEGTVTLSADQGLRIFLRACDKDPALRVSAGTEASADAEKSLTPAAFCAMREHAKGQETVKLNFGGVQREVHRSTADRIPLLAAMLRFPRREGAENAPLFLDVSPEAFEVLLEVARGRSPAYLDSLEPSLRGLVQDYAEYAGMTQCAPGCFHFRLQTSNPLNTAATNRFAYLTNRGASCTTGIRPQWNTVVGNTSVPLSGQSYWEVEIESLGTAGKEFMIGVVSTQFTSLNSYLDCDSNGWGIYHNSAGAVFLRAGGANHGNSCAEVFPMENGTRVGVLVDAERGTLLFFHNGDFKMSHMMNIKGQDLLPALSVYTDAVLTVRTGMQPPI